MFLYKYGKPRYLEEASEGYEAIGWSKSDTTFWHQNLSAPHQLAIFSFILLNCVSSIFPSSVYENPDITSSN